MSKRPWLLRSPWTWWPAAPPPASKDPRSSIAVSPCPPSRCPQHSPPDASLPARLAASTDRRLSALPRVVMEYRMLMMLLPALSRLATKRLATKRLACRQRARTLAVTLAQVARCRRAVDWILSPPGVHSYKLHRRLWKRSPPNETRCSQILPGLPSAGTVANQLSESQASEEQIWRNGARLPGTHADFNRTCKCSQRSICA